MARQLEAVRQDIRSITDKVVKTERKLAAAEHAHNGERDLLLSINNQLLSLNNQLLSLHEQENILLRSQATSKPCLHLVHTGLPVLTQFALHPSLHVQLLVCKLNSCVVPKLKAAGPPRLFFLK